MRWSRYPPVADALRVRQSASLLASHMVFQRSTVCVRPALVRISQPSIGAISSSQPCSAALAEAMDLLLSLPHEALKAISLADFQALDASDAGSRFAESPGCAA